MSNVMDENNEVEVELKKEKISRLPKCEVCAVSDAKYTCPKCEVKSCCLKCVNIHKVELECDGIRDRTKFIPVNKFTNTDFYNDYAFLEECSRFVYGKKRNIIKKFTNFDKPLPHYLSKLKRVARDRGTMVMFLPEHFSRRKSNSTRVAKQGHIMWRVDFVFGNKLYSHKGMPIPETTRLSKIFCDKLESLECTELNCYKSAGVINVKMLLKAERINGCSNKFYELDPTLSLKENLIGKCLVEYPTIYVFLKDHAYGLDIVHSDDELEEEEKTKNEDSQVESLNENQDDSNLNTNTEEDKKQFINANQDSRKTSGSNERKRSYRGETLTTRIAREEREKIKKEVEEQVRKKPKNLLFVTGYSSEEDISSDES